MRKYIEIGRITRPHGINGAVKVDPWCDSPSVLAKIKKIYFYKDKSYTEVAVIRGSVQKDQVILTLSGIDTPETAERLRNTVVFALRDDIPIPDGAFLVDDLKGLSVIDEGTGKLYGTLFDVISGGASDIYEIDTPTGKVLIPAVKEFIKRIDPESGIYISPIGGMFDED